jgi:hypothetical protein
LLLRAPRAIPKFANSGRKGRRIEGRPRLGAALGNPPTFPAVATELPNSA